MHQLLQNIGQVSMKHILIIDDYLLMQINQYHNFQKSFVQVETPLYLTSIPYQSSYLLIRNRLLYFLHLLHDMQKSIYFLLYTNAKSVLSNHSMS